MDSYYFKFFTSPQIAKQINMLIAAKVGNIIFILFIYIITKEHDQLEKELRRLQHFHDRQRTVNFLVLLLKQKRGIEKG